MSNNDEASKAVQSTESMELDASLQPVPQDSTTLPSTFVAAPMAIDEDSLFAAAANCDCSGAPIGSGSGPSGMERASSLSFKSIKRSGIEVYTWGRGDCGQLGLSVSSSGHSVIDSSPHPRPVESLRGKDIICAAGGAFHSVAVAVDGEMYTWGANDEGQCAIRKATNPAAAVKEEGEDEESEIVQHPTRIESLEKFKISMAACGANHTIAIAEDGGVLAFGAADFGQLGLGSGLPGSKVIQPKICKTIREARIARAAAGGNHTLFLETSGMVHATGDASFGALGSGGAHTASVFSPLLLLKLWPEGVSQLAAGESHSAALTVNGVLFTWGRGRAGALGLGSFQNVSEPTLVKSLSGVKQVTCGNDHTVAITTNGEAFAWGQGKWGATGLGHGDAVCSPQRMAGLGGGGDDDNGTMVDKKRGVRVVQASAGGRHTLLLTATNEVWATGCNENGQCGESATEGSIAQESGSTTVIFAPRKMAGMPPAGGKIIAFVASGGDHSIAVVQDALHHGSIIPGPVAGEPHGAQWLPATPLPLPLLVRSAATAVATKDQGGKNALPDAVKELKLCIEQTFANPAYLLAAFLAFPPAAKLFPVAATRGADGETGSGIGKAARRSEIDSRGDRSPRDSASKRPREGNTATARERPAAPLQQLGVPSLNLASISDMYQGILKLYDQGVVSVLGTASIRLLDMIERYLTQLYPGTPGKPNLNLDAALLPELAWIPPTLFIALQNPLASDPTTYGSAIIMRLGRIISTTLPAQQRIPVRRALQALLVQLPADAFAARCVRPVQRYLSHLVTSGRLGAGRLEAMMAGVLLDVLRQANEDSAPEGKIPFSEFYNKALSDAADLQAEYIAWVKHRDSAPNALVSFCQMPFLLTPEAKSNILHGESMMQKQQHMSAAAMQAFFRGQNPSEAGFLRLSVRRTHVVEDALNGLAVHSDDLKKPLKVQFISGGIAEPAQDEGGVRKEFFQLLTRDLFRPEFGMFTYDAATRMYWIHPASFENENEFGMVGALMGLAIYNAILLDVHFPLVLYKKLLGGKPTFADLKATFPDLGRGLQQLLDFEPAADVEDIFCRTFEAEFDYYGEIQKRELIPGGSEIPVTGDNRKDYVEKYASWVLNESISTQFSAFARGFLKVCGGPALTAFTPAELELLVCGLPHLDFEGLQRAAKYEGGYTASTQVVLWFWEIVRKFSMEQKRQFLMFTTGSDRAPVGGLGSLSIVVQRAGPDSDRLPTSHTCFDTLLLPEYVSQEKLAERLNTAIANAQGFGLQ